MSKMFAEIKRIVDEDISSRATQFDVIFEAITNAIHAKATNIDCLLNSADPLTDEGQELIRRKVSTITITDNGEGLTDDNYSSFCKYRSEHKKALGCKGVGRFVFLKVYENARYKSSLKKELEVREFKFDFQFDTDNIKKDVAEVTVNSTEIFLQTLTPQYLDYDRHIDRRIDLDLDAIREKVLLNLIPTLFFYKKKGVAITINFIDTAGQTPVSISSDDVPDFAEKKFVIRDRDGKSFDFILNHRIEDTPGKLHAFYCANNRTVCEFSDQDFRLSLPYGYSGFLLLESEYFDRSVNNERNNFGIFPVRTDAFSSLSWEMINEKLKSEITDIVKSGIPETTRLNKEKIEEIQMERPYLINYIDETDIDIAGFIDKKHLIEGAKKKFDIAKEKLLTNAGKDSYSDEELNEAIELTQNELVSYINDRAQVLQRLRILIDKKERVESIIHNLFMERRSDDDYFAVGKNNLWLLDDRFTTYSYAASEKHIKYIMEQIGQDTNETETLEDRPDLSIFFSHNPNTPEKLKSVLVEIKPFDYKSKSDRQKFAGIQQLIDYIKAFKSKENIEEVFAFLITEIDTKLAVRLRDNDYTAVFSLDSPIFHRFYRELGISIYVISASTLVKDAEARNKIFLDIIRKQSRLKTLLGGENLDAVPF